MNNAARTALRLVLCAALGWLAGETVSRTVLASRDGHPRERMATTTVQNGKPSSLPPSGGTGEWQEFLAARGIAMDATITEKDLLDLSEIVHGESGKVSFTDPETRLGMIRRMAHADPDLFPQLLNLVAHISDARVQRQVAGAFFAAWAEHDPRAAIEAAAKIPGLSMAGLTGVLKSWSEKDPNGMMAWLHDSRAFGWAKMQAHAYALFYLTETDPAQAMQVASGSGTIADRRRVYIDWSRQDASAAQAWIAAEPESVRRQMFDSRVQARTERDPAGAWELSLTETGGPKELSTLLPSVLEAWQQKDGPAARAALAKLPAEVWDASFSLQAGRTVGRGNAPDTEMIANQLPPEAQGRYWSGVLDGALEDGTARRALVVSAFSHLPPEETPQHAEYAAKVTISWMHDDPAAASGWVRDLSPGLTRDTAVESLVGMLVKTDPDAAAQWAAEIRDDKLRTSAMGYLAK